MPICGHGRSRSTPCGQIPKACRVSIHSSTLSPRLKPPYHSSDGRLKHARKCNATAISVLLFLCFRMQEVPGFFCSTGSRAYSQSPPPAYAEEGQTEGTKQRALPCSSDDVSGFTGLSNGRPSQPVVGLVFSMSIHGQAGAPTENTYLPYIRPPKLVGTS